MKGRVFRKEGREECFMKRGFREKCFVKSLQREREESCFISKSNGRVCEELINCIWFPRIKGGFQKKLGIMRNGVWREGKCGVFISKKNYGSSK